MTRDEILEFALDFARDEYARAQARLALIETKAQLIAVTVGIFATLLATMWPDRVSHSTSADGVMLLSTLSALGLSLVLSLSVSSLTNVRPPPNAEEVFEKCEKLIAAVGDTNRAVDAAAVERVVGQVGGYYVVASESLERVLNERTGRLKAAQIALIASFMFMSVWIGLPLVGVAIKLINTGAQ